MGMEIQHLRRQRVNQAVFTHYQLEGYETKLLDKQPRPPALRGPELRAGAPPSNDGTQETRTRNAEHRKELCSWRWRDRKNGVVLGSTNEETQLRLPLSELKLSPPSLSPRLRGPLMEEPHSLNDLGCSDQGEVLPQLLSQPVLL